MPDSDLADGAVLTNSFYTTYLRQQVVVTCTAATRPTGVEGRLIYETDTDQVMCYNGSTWVELSRTSAWATWTAQFDQGATTNIAHTVAYAKVLREGRKVTITWQVSFTASGSASSSIVVNLPYTAADTQGVQGHAHFLDSSSSTRYVLAAYPSSTTQVIFVHDTSGASGFGAAPNIAIASGDELGGSITYESA